MPDEEGTQTQAVADHKEAQTLANIEQYGRIYTKCLNVAERIATGTGRANSDSVLKIAETLFSQFFHDQIDMAKQRQIMAVLQQAMQRARGF